MMQRMVCAGLVLGLALSAGAAFGQDTAREPVTEQSVARGDTASFWVGGEATADSLDVFWSNLQQEWLDLVPENISGFGLEEFKVDSLQSIGSIKLEELVAGTLWRGRSHRLVLPDFNRVQGPVVRLGWSLRNLGPNRPFFRINGGYAFANQRPVVDGRLELPLVRRRWRLSSGQGLGREYQLLSLRLTGSKDVARFAGDDRRVTRSFTSLVYGADPNHYFEERQVGGRLTARVARQARWWVGAGYSQQRALDQETDWNLIGRDLSPQGNRRADGLDVRRFATGADWTVGSLWVRGEMAWLRASNTDFRRVAVSAKVDRLDGLGNQWELRGQHRWIDRAAPIQWRSWLGGYNAGQGMLRGYESGELSGEIAHQASLDIRFNFDPLRILRIPVLKGMGWQPILFADWGKTRNQGEGGAGGSAAVDPTALILGEGEQDWRADVGFGFGRRYDLPGFGAFNKMRLYIAKPVGNGQGDRNWTVLFAFEL